MAVRDAPPLPRTAGSGGWRPSSRLQRRFALAAVVTNGAIAVTGAVVRVTGSGLGCPTWPECHPGSVVPVLREENSTFHQLIEFGNRTLTGVVLVASLGAFLVIWRARPQRRSLVRLAAALPALVVFQAIWGGLTVLFGLAWWTVAPHMLISLGLLSVAVWVHQRLGEADAPATPTVPRPLQLLAWATSGVLLLLCVAGTLVTAAGPHAGDSTTPRLDLPVRGLAQVHADLMFTYLGLLVAFGVALAAVGAPALLRRRTWVLVGVTVGQGVLGIVQYQLGVPEVLVVLHVCGAVLLVTAAVRMLFATRTRSATSVS
jgi:cytochrome c oxidase assembly protein subunit 15